MNYIIKNQIDGSYLTYDPKKTPQCRWVETLEDASKWDNMKKAQNFMNHNYRALMRFVPAKDAKIVPCHTVSHLEEKPIFTEAIDEMDVFGQVEKQEDCVVNTEDVQNTYEVDVEEEADDVIHDVEEAIRRMEALPDLDAVGKEVRLLCRFFDAMNSEVDGMVNDYLHKIELGEGMNAAERAVIFKRLQETLRRRRVAKNMRKKLNIYYEVGLLDRINKFTSATRAVEERMANATYTPRALPELFGIQPDEETA